MATTTDAVTSRVAGTPAATAARSPRGPVRRRFGDLPVALTFLAPAIAAAIVLRIWPMVRAVQDSLHSTPLGIQPTRWVGLEQFRNLFADPAFTNSLKITLL